MDVLRRHQNHLLNDLDDLNLIAEELPNLDYSRIF